MGIHGEMREGLGERAIGIGTGRSEREMDMGRRGEERGGMGGGLKKAGQAKQRLLTYLT